MQGTSHVHHYAERRSSSARGVEDRQLLDLSGSHVASTLKTYFNNSELVRGYPELGPIPNQHTVCSSVLACFPLLNVQLMRTPSSEAHK
jgi:hypothetical protein